MHPVVPLPFPDSVETKWRFLLNCAAAGCDAPAALLLRYIPQGTECRAVSDGFCDRIAEGTLFGDAAALLASLNLTATETLPLSAAGEPFGELLVADDHPRQWDERSRAVLRNLRDAIELDLSSLAEEHRRQDGRPDAARRLLNLCAEAAGIVVWEYDLARDELRFGPVNPDQPSPASGLELPSDTTLTLARFLGGTHENDHETVARILEVFRGGTEDSVHFEHRLRKTDGGWRWLLSVGKALTEETDRQGSAYGISVDITSLKEAEHELHVRAETLKKRETLLRFATRLGRCGAWEYDRRTDLIRVSPEAGELFGFPPNLERPLEFFFAMVPEEERGAVRAAMETTLRDGIDFKIEYPVAIPDGRIMYVRQRAKVVRDDEGTISGIWGVIQDITEQAREEKRRDLLWGLAKAAFWEYDAKENVYRGETRIADLLELPGERFVLNEEQVGRLIHPDDRAAYFEAIARSVTERRNDFELGCRLAVGGKTKYVRTIVHQEFNAEGEVVERYGINMDVTEEKEAQRRLAEQAEQLRHAQKMEAIGQLAGGVAHEFNNLLQVISGYGELLEGPLQHETEGLEHLDAVMSASRRGAELVRQLMQFSHKEPARTKPVDPRRLIAGMLGMLRRVLGENVELELRPCGEIPRVFADEAQLRQVIMNLCLNARDAIGSDGGRITIALDRAQMGPNDGEPAVSAGEYLVLTVADTGHGMTREVRQRIFDPFFTTKEVGKGTGLGLSAVLGIVEYHHGGITVESEPDKGAVFRVFLPVYVQEHSFPPSPLSVPPAEIAEFAQNAPPAAVLVAEDNPFVLELAVHSLSKLGFEPIPARDGAEALELFALNKDRIGLLVLDVIMPGKNGPEVYREIADEGRDLPVIFATGYGDSFIELDPVPGCHSFLAKPFNRRSLEKAIHEVWNRDLARR